MARRSSRPSAAQFGGSYHDRIPLEDDYETITFRNTSLSGPNSLPTAAYRSSVSTAWTIGDNWAPEDSCDFSLDPDNGWYDEVVEADICDVMEELVVPKKSRKKRSHISVCLDITYRSSSYL